ncbi:hypothetical protein [Frigoribacterium sp. Leaf44]|uniref:hypothetical protein n=1 Tax=Frigoribacterium sp. Leaf44 TaxID=1736220 RepID=UPI0006F7F4BA|nr:hypothetical protein [Frigoribacterium sp. Leaf44]KQN45427.1 hypothetical protein ASE87_02180 [Frigoribacterium sp. Leaf44]
MRRRPYRNGERPDDQRERRRAFAAAVRTRPPLRPTADRELGRALARLDELVEKTLLSGDHDRLLDETRVSVWPRELDAVVTVVVDRLDPPPSVDRAAVAAAVADNLEARFGLRPGASPTERSVVLWQSVAGADSRLAENGWERDVLSDDREALAEFFASDGDPVRARLTRSSGRLHLELRGTNAPVGDRSSSYAVLSRSSALVLVDDPRGLVSVLDESTAGALRDVVVAWGELADHLDERHAETDSR